MSFPQVVSSHQLVLGKQPKEDMNLWRYNQFPHSWQEQGLDSSKVNHMVQRTRGIDTLVLKLPDQSMVSLVVRTLVKILKLQLSKLIGLNLLIIIASFALGIKVIIAKLSL